MNIKTFKELISANVTFDEYSTFKVVIREPKSTVQLVRDEAVSLRPQRVRPVDSAKRAVTKTANKAAERPIERPAEKQRPNT